MDSNQFNGQSYKFFLQMPPPTQNSQNRFPFYPPPFLSPSPPNYFMSNTQTPSTVNSQSSQTYHLILTNSPTNDSFK